MAMDREALKERINKLPEFEKRDVQVRTYVEDKNTAVKVSDDPTWEQQRHQAICEKNNTLAYAYVSKGYKLVQFKDIFLPILDSIKEDVKGYVAHYGGFAMMKIFPENDELRDGTTQFGLVAVNSVDLSASVMVKFVIRHNDRYFTVPPKIAGLKKQHTGKVENISRDYISMVGKVKSLWKQIATKFPQFKIVQEIKDDTEEENLLEFGTVVDRLKLGKRLAKKVQDNFNKSTYEGHTYSLWDFLTMALEEVSNANYKSEVHREKRIDKLCTACFEYAFMLGI